MIVRTEIPGSQCDGEEGKVILVPPEQLVCGTTSHNGHPITVLNTIDTMYSSANVQYLSKIVLTVSAYFN